MDGVAVAEGMVEFALPKDIPFPLTLTILSVSEGQEVQKGESLAGFDVNNLREYVETAAIEYHQLNRQSMEFTLQISAAIDNLIDLAKNQTKQIGQLEASLSQAKEGTARYAELEKQLAAAQAVLALTEDDLALAVNEGIWAGQSKALLEMKTEAAKAHWEDLIAWVEEYESLTSPLDGIVQYLPYTEGSAVNAGEVWMRIIPADTSRWYVKQPLRESEAHGIAEDQWVEMSYEIEDQGMPKQIKVNGNVKKVNRSFNPEDQYILVEPNGGSSFPKGAISMEILLESVSSQLTLPNSAFIQPDQVYVLEEVDGFWGKELYARRRYVQIGISSMGQTAIERGISSDDYVIIGWDRSVEDGQRVMLPLE